MLKKSLNSFNPQTGELSGNKLIWPFDQLRIIPYQLQTGAMNMALDYYFARTIKATDKPVLRLYGWNPFCLSFGFHQSADGLNRQALRQRGYDLIRRPTGGSAIFHSAEITYSIIIPKTSWDQHQLYEFVHQVFYRALHLTGYPVELFNGHADRKYLNRGAETFACFNRSAYSELRYNGRKILGSAQKVYRNSVLQHGSLLITRQQDEIIDFLQISSPEKEKYRQVLQNSSVSLSEIKSDPIDPETIANQISSVFSQQCGAGSSIKKLTGEEINEASALTAGFVVA
jgi:lipoate-protein ligase A